MALTDKLTSIADAIRGKTGKTEEMTLDQMATEIAEIEVGGGNSSVSLTLTADGNNAQNLVDAILLAFDVKNGFYATCNKDNPNLEEYSRGLAQAYYCGEYGDFLIGYRYRGELNEFFTSSGFTSWDFITKVGDVFDIILF